MSSKIVDDRVVSLEFDNKNFESNVSTTMNTLDKLKSKLKFPSSSKAFDNISQASKRVDLSGISSAIDNVNVKFSALDVAAATVLSNITNTAFNAGKRIANALTLEPVMSGFQEYETQINAVQTILANTQSKGTTLDDVNAALDELNKYADQTIYNFTQMTKNIGTFTAAGVGLEKSVTSIKGIANLAAISGSNAQQASTAMYQLSQALAAGRVSLMDWNSVVNAGMGGEVFQTALKRTATQMGKDVDGLIEKYGSFRESLTSGQWLTTEVLTETLTQLSGAYTEADLIAKGYSESQAKEIVKLAETAVSAATDVKTFTQLIDTSKEALQSGWTQTWEIVFGDFEEAKSLWSGISTTINDMVNASAEARNSLLKGALKSSPWEKLSESVAEAGVSLTDFESAAISVAKENGIAVDDMIKKYGSFEKSLQGGWLTTNIFRQTIERLIGSQNEVGASTEELNSKFEELSSVVNKVIRGDFGNGAARMDALAKAGYDYAEVQGLVNKKIWEGSISIEDLSDSQLKSIGYTEEQITKLRDLADQAERTGTPINELMNDLGKPSGRDLLLDSVKNIFEAIGKVLTTIKDTWEKVFPKLESSQLYNIIEGFHEFTESLILSDGAIQNLADTIEGLFRALEVGLLFMSGGAKIVKRLVTSILNILQLDFLGFTARLGKMITAFRNWLLTNNAIVQSVVTVGRQIENFLLTVVENVAKWVTEFQKLPIINEILTNITNGFNNFLNTLNSVFEGINSWLETNNLFVKAFEIISPAIEQAIEKFNSWLETIKSSENIPKAIAESIMRLIDQLYISVVGTFSKVTSTIKEKLSGIWEAFNEWMENAKNVENLPKYILDSLLSGLKTIASSIQDAISSLFSSFNIDTNSVGINFIQGLVNGIQNGIGIVVQTVIELGKLILERLKGVLGIHSPSTEAFNIAYNIMLGLVNGLRAGIDMVITTVKSIASLILDVLSEVDLADLMLAGGVGGFLYVGNRFAKALELIAKPLEGFSKIEKSIADVFNSISNYIDAKQLTIKAEAMYTIAKAVAVLAGSLFVLSLIDGSKLWGAVGALVAISAALGLLTFAIGKINNVGDVGKISLVVISLGVSLLAISKAVQMISDINPKNAQIMFETFGLMAISLYGVLFTLSKLDSKLDPKSISKIGNVMLKFAGSMLVMSLVIKILAGMSGPDLFKAGITIAGIGAVMIAMMAISKLGVNNTINSGAGLIKIATSFLVVVGVIKLISGISDDELKRGGAVIAAMSLLFAGFIALSSIKGVSLSNAGSNLMAMAGAMAILAVVVKIVGGLSVSEILKGIGFMTACGWLFGLVTLISYMAGTVGKSASINFLAMAGAVSILAMSIRIISDLSYGDVIKGAAFMTAATVLFGIVGVASKLAGQYADKAGTMFLKMAIAMGALVIVIRLLRGLEVGDVIRGIVFMGACTAMFGILIALSNFAGAYADKAGAMLMKMAVPIGVLALSIGLLSLLDTKKVIAASAAMSMVVGMLGVLMHAANISAKAAVSIIAIGLVIGELAFIINLLSKLPIQNVMGAASSLSLVLLSMSASMALISYAGPIALKAIPGILAISGVIVIIAAILGTLSSMDLNLPIQNAISISTLLLAMSGVSLILSALGATGPAALVGAGVMVGVVGILGTVITGIGALMAYIPEAEQFLDKGISVLTKLFSGIGQMFGSLISGFVGGVAESLPILATKLSEFMGNLEPFLSGASSIKPESMQGVVDLAKALLILTGTDVLNSITQFFTGGNSLSEFAEQLEPFGESLVAYSNSIQGINSTAISESAKAAKALVEVAKAVPNEGGWLADIVGENNLSAFGDNLVPFGEGLVEYAKSVEGLNAQAISNSIPAAQSIVDLAKTIPNEGGWLAGLIGDNDLGTFASNLKTFGESLYDYGVAVTDLNASSISNSIPAAQAIVEIASAIPNSGGIFTAFTGDNDLTTFGSSLTQFGNGIKSYAQAVSEISNYGDVESSVSIAKSIVQLANEIPTTGGIFTALDGDNSLSYFATQLPLLGSGISGFITNLNGANLTSISDAKQGILDLIDVINSMTNINTAGVDQFTNAINTLSTANIGGFNEAFKGNVDSFVKIGNQMSDALATGLSNGKSSVSTASGDLARAAVDAVSKYTEKFGSAGKKDSKEYANGIEDNAGKASKKADSMASDAADSASSHSDAFYSAGEDAATGFANGISANSFKAAARAAAMAKKAAEAAEAELDINSPSKVFRKIGTAVPEGFAQGISKLGNVVSASARGMANNAMDTTRSLMASVYSLVESDEEFQPTIAPIMDLSNVRSGAAQISSMLGFSNRSMSLAASANSLFNRSKYGNQNEVASALKELKASLAERSGDTYQINGITYDDGSNVSSAVETLIRAAKIERRT